MKYLVLIVGMVLLIGVTFAEPGDVGQQHHRGKAGGPPPWFDEVGVTGEQREEMRAIREAGGSREDIRAVLTPEQQAKVEELKATARGAGHHDRLGHMKDGLDLSDEQVAQMRKIRDEGGSRQDMFEVLTPEQQEKMRQSKGKRKGMPAPPAQE